MKTTNTKGTKLTLTRESIKAMRVRTAVRTGAVPGGNCGYSDPIKSTACATGGCYVNVHHLP